MHHTQYGRWSSAVSAASYIALRSIVIVELLGIQKLTNAFGLSALFQGIACVLGSPLSGGSENLYLLYPLDSNKRTVKYKK